MNIILLSGGSGKMHMEDEAVPIDIELYTGALSV